VFWSYVVPDTVADFPDDGYVPESVDDIPDGVSQESIPISPKYFAGFRSLGSEVSTEKTKEVPAWKQDLKNTTERAGRAQDKEDLMERLRDPGTCERGGIASYSSPYFVSPVSLTND